MPRIHARADWNQWRGPNRDGRVGDAMPAAWPKTLTRRWKIEVGEGHSSPVVVAGRAFCLSRQDDDEVVRALDLTTGKTIWRARYPAPYEMNPAARGHGKGPKSTPIVADGRLFTLGISGILTAWDARSGKVLWRKEFAGAFQTTSPEFGAAMSPLVDKNLLIAHVGGRDDGALMAFDVKTGAVRWRWGGDGPAYASPVIATVGGVRQLVTQTQKLCVGLDPASGKLLWSVPFTTPYSQNCVTPVVSGNRLVFGGIQQATFALKTERGAPQRVWETRDATFYMSTPVASDGRLYGLSERRQGQMACLDAATGKTLWTGEGRLGDNASVWDAGRHLLVLTTGGELLVSRKDDGGALAEVARYSVADSATWASPAFVDGGMLVKDVASLALWRWA